MNKPIHTVKGKHFDDGITFAKFIATFLVMNSHMSICYPKLAYLATGGAIGNALFFFISGFTLFLGGHTSFGDFIKKRLSRIYPVVIAMAILSCLFWGNDSNIVRQITYYWFINCIIIYYIILWVIRHYNIPLTFVTLFSLIITVLVFILGYDFKGGLMYGNDSYRYFIYFTYMAFGAYLAVMQNGYYGSKSNKENQGSRLFKLDINKFKYSMLHTVLVITSLITCVMLWYGITYLSKSYIQVFSLLPLYGICIGIYMIGHMYIMKRLIKYRIIKSIIVFCGNLCLEVYLIQKYIFTDFLNCFFPINIPIVMLMVLLSAKVLQIAGRFISQTFAPGPYIWYDLIKL